LSAGSDFYFLALNAMNKLFLAVALVATFGSAVIADHDPAWTDFRGSFLIGKNESFAPFPKTINDELVSSENWVQVSTDCTNGGKFNGFQYVKNNDYSVGLLYDTQGTIAGIQMLIPKSVVLTSTNTLNYDAIPMYQNATYNGQDYYVLTAYLVEPSTICGAGRSAEDLSEDGTGTGLWIQNGTSASALVPVPQNRPESENEDENDGWTKNNCFPAMGYHNFYSIQQYVDSNCNEMVPIFGLYNKNSKQLHGFGFITVGNITNPRFEQPPAAAIRMILGAGRTPECVLEVQEREVVTSLHVYFTEEPWKIACPIIESSVSYFKAATSWIRGKLSG